MAESVPSPSPVAIPAIELRGLVKDFAIGLRGVKLRAVEQLDLRVEAGQVFGLLGRILLNHVVCMLSATTISQPCFPVLCDIKLLTTAGC
jgi:hypothetical protein